MAFICARKLFIYVRETMDAILSVLVNHFDVLIPVKVNSYNS